MLDSSQADAKVIRPPVRVVAQMPADLADDLARYASANYRSRSSVVVAAVARYLRLERAADGET